MRAIDITNQTFGEITAIHLASNSKCNHREWHCVCSCGTQLTVLQSDLRRGHTTSCGCRRVKTLKSINTKHGRCHTKIYYVWQGIKDRCNKSTHKSWKDYGGRGITICDRWVNSFENFILDMGERPFPSAEIDRINNSLGYSKENCRWATHAENMKNTRRNKNAVTISII